MRYTQHTLNPGDELDLTVEPGEQCRVVARPCPNGASPASAVTRIEPVPSVASLRESNDPAQVRLAPGQSLDLRSSPGHYYVTASACRAGAGAGTVAPEHDQPTAEQNSNEEIEPVRGTSSIAAFAEAPDFDSLRPHVEQALADDPNADDLEVPFDVMPFVSPQFGVRSIRVLVQVRRHGGGPRGGR